MPLWNFLIFLLLPPGSILGPITGTTKINSQSYFERFLRKYKLDEFPQLFNILMGEMSFVGPRPDLESFVLLIPLKEREIVLSVKPGITSLATLKFRDEESILSKEKDPENYNNEILIPEKTKLNIEYIKKNFK